MEVRDPGAPGVPAALRLRAGSDGRDRRADRRRSFDILDINMGCPVPKIVGNGGMPGADEESEAHRGEIIAKVSRLSKSPLTVKFRKEF